jgi:hypothetical protein
MRTITIDRDLGLTAEIPEQPWMVGLTNDEVDAGMYRLYDWQFVKDEKNPNRMIVNLIPRLIAADDDNQFGAACSVCGWPMSACEHGDPMLYCECGSKADSICVLCGCGVCSDCMVGGLCEICRHESD